MTVALVPRNPHRVVIGVARQWRFPSSRFTDVIYTTTLYGDGSWGCDCPGFEHGRRSDRLCRHLDQARDLNRVPGLAELLGSG